MNAVDQIVGRDVLQHVRLGARLEGARDLVVGVVGRQHDDARARIALADLAHRLDAFHDRHAQIEQRHVGVIALVRGNGFDTVAGFGNDLQIGLLIDDVRDAGAKQRVIVDDEHARLAGGDRNARISQQHGPASEGMMVPRPRRPRCRRAGR